ncbi:MAG: hypothetical protein ABJN40_07375 [Sneathiella sp.]
MLMIVSVSAQAGQNVKIREFLTYDDKSQEYFLASTIWTAAVIATQIRQDLASCIADWYTNDPMIIKKRNAEILDTMKGYPDSYPSGLVVAILQKQCGKFGQ